MLPLCFSLLAKSLVTFSSTPSGTATGPAPASTSIWSGMLNILKGSCWLHKISTSQHPNAKASMVSVAMGDTSSSSSKDKWSSRLRRRASACSGVRKGVALGLCQQSWFTLHLNLHVTGWLRRKLPSKSNNFQQIPCLVWSPRMLDDFSSPYTRQQFNIQCLCVETSPLTNFVFVTVNQSSNDIL